MPTLLIAIISWTGLTFLILNYSPEGKLIMVSFLLLFLAGFFTLALLLGNSKNGLLGALFLISILIFRYLDIGSLLNLSIWLAIFVTLVIYLK